MKVLGTLLLLISMVVHSSASSIKVECDGEKWVQKWTEDCSSFYAPVVFTFGHVSHTRKTLLGKKNGQKLGICTFKQYSNHLRIVLVLPMKLTTLLLEYAKTISTEVSGWATKLKVVTYSSSSKEDCSNPTTKVFFDSTDSKR